MSNIMKAMNMSDSVKTRLPASLYNAKEFAKGGKPFAKIYVDSKGKWHLTSSSDISETLTPNKIILE